MLGSQCSPCCGDGNNPCAPTRKRMTITISGLPSTYAGQGVVPRWVNNRELSDDACSYTLFRVMDSVQPQSCKYTTVWHSALNWTTDFGSDNRLTLDITANLLELFFFQAGLSVVLRPPAGKTFQTFPFDEVLVPQNATLTDFASVRVVIDDSTAEYIPFVCPDNSRFSTAFYGSCTNGVHTLPQFSRTFTQTGYTDTSVGPIHGCKPCESNYYATYTSTVTRDPNCPSSGDAASSGCPTVGTSSSDVPDLIVNASFSGPDIEGYSLSALSGSYALKWSNVANLRMQGGYVGLYFEDFLGLEEIDSNGNGKPIRNSFLLDRSQRGDGLQGWGINYRTPPGGLWRLGMEMAVVQVKSRTVINRTARTVVSTPCPTGQFTYQIFLIVYSVQPSEFDGGFAYWTRQLMAFADVPCAPRQCRGVPSVSLSATETIYLPLVGPWYASRGKLGQISVSLS